MPSEQEIREKAVELGLATEDGPMPGHVRAEAARALLDSRLPPPAAPGIVLSRSRVAVADGHLEITLTHYPTGAAQ